MILLLKYKENNVYWLWYVFVKWKKNIYLVVIDVILVYRYVI